MKRLALSLLFLSGLMVGCSPDEGRNLSGEETISSYQNGEMSYTQLSEIAQDKKSNLTSKEQEKVVDTVVENADMNALKYTSLYMTLIDDIEVELTKHKDIDLVTGKNIELIENDLVKALLNDMDKNKMKFVSIEDGLEGIVVAPDYSKMEKDYDVAFSDKAKNIKEYEEYVVAHPVYDNENKVLLLENVYGRLQLANEFGKADRSESGFMWEYERYQNFLRLMGWRETYLMEDNSLTKLSENGIKQLKQFAEDHKGEPYIDDLEKTISSIELEGGEFGEKTELLVEELTKKHFEEYLAYLEGE